MCTDTVPDTGPAPVCCFMQPQTRPLSGVLPALLQEQHQRRSAFHHAALMSAVMVVVAQVLIQVDLQLLDALAPGCAPPCSSKPLDKSITLRTPYSHRAMLHAFPLQEKFVGGIDRDDR